jgi:hypothetical protein
MYNYLIGNEIKMMLGASRFLRLLRDKRSKDDILSVRYVPPVLGSDSLGNYKVTFKNGSIQKRRRIATIQ